MNNPAALEIRCADFLKDNHSHYARKARRKKIVLVSVEATNDHSGDVRLLLGASKLIAAERSYDVESPALIIRKLSEFTWDFLVYSILDFHPVLSVIDVFFLLTGPLYNWRLRRQLRALSDAETLVRTGQRTRVLVGFRGIPARPDRLVLYYRCGDGEPQMLESAVG